jgi:hypothetical protein
MLRGTIVGVVCGCEVLSNVSTHPFPGKAGRSGFGQVVSAAIFVRGGAVNRITGLTDRAGDADSDEDPDVSAGIFERQQDLYVRGETFWSPAVSSDPYL